MKTINDTDIIKWLDFNNASVECRENINGAIGYICRSPGLKDTVGSSARAALIAMIESANALELSDEANTNKPTI